jgi:hypothetical protein
LCKSIVQAHRGLGCELIEEHFDDEGYSGATLERPALKRLLSLVRSGAVMANFRKNLQVFVNLQRFSISRRRVAWAASETMTVLLEGRAFLASKLSVSPFNRVC